MPVKRSTRASSVEDTAPPATRTSRRLRSTQDNNSSPLRALSSPPRRKRNAKKPTEPSNSTLYTIPPETEPTTALQAQKSIEVEYNESQHPETKTETKTAAGATETKAAYVPTWVKAFAPSNASSQMAEATAWLTKTQNFGILRQVFLTPISSREVQSMFSTACSGYNMFMPTEKSVEDVLKQVAKQMTDEVKVDLMIKQRAKIVEQDEDKRRNQHSLEQVQKENDRLREKLKAREVDREVESQLTESEVESEPEAPLRETKTKTPTQTPTKTSTQTPTKTPTSNKKRSAPADDESHHNNEQRPARRVKVAPSDLDSTGGELEQSINEQYPLVSALVAANSMPSPKKTTHVENHGLHEPFDPTNKYHTFIAKRMREREQEEKQRKWLGAAFANIDDESDDGIPIVDETSESDGANSKLDLGEAEFDQDAESPPRNHSTSPVLSKSHALTPIQEESEPQTPTTSRWGFRSILAPVSRLFGATPRTEPARRVTQTSLTGISAPASTPSNNNQMNHRRSSQSSLNEQASPASAEKEPATPTPNTGITSASFMPQSAPQARTAPPPRRRSHRENLKAYDNTQLKRKAAAERAQRRLAEEEAAEKEAADQAEDARLREEALRCRQQSLDMQKTGEKRKIRVDDLDVIPNPKSGGYGMNEKYFEEDSDGEVYVEEDVSMVDAFTPPPAKKVRFEGPSTDESEKKKHAWWQSDEWNNVSPFKKTPPASHSSDPHRAQPYSGVMFADTRNEATHDGGNVFDQVQSRDAKKAFEESYLSPVSYGKKHGVWTGPKESPKARAANFNYAGHFQVPDDSDTESEEEDADLPPSPTPAQKVATEKGVGAGGDFRSRQQEIADAGAIESHHGEKDPEARTNLFMKRSEQVSGKTQSGNSADEPVFTQQPPPTPTPAHAALPSTPATISNAVSDSDALAKVRLQAEKYKPKTPSGLRATSRLSASPSIPPGQTQPGAIASLDDTTVANADVAVNFPIAPQEPQSNVPYEETIQYAIDLANAIPFDQLPINTITWPPTKPAPWPLDPAVEAALKETEEHPDYDAHCEQLWAKMWSEHQQEKAAAAHTPIAA